MVSLAKKTMHQRPTYETLVRDTILEPHDKINLPNRKATLLRSNQKLQMFDDEPFLDLDEENKRIAAERMQQMEFTRMVHESPDMDYTSERANQSQPSDSSNRPPPPQPSPPHQHPKMSTKNTQTTSDTATVGTQASYKPPPQPQGKHVGTQARPEKPAMVDVGIDADQQDMKHDMQDVIQDHANAKRKKQNTAERLVKRNLGPGASDTADPTFIDKMVKLERKPKEEKRSRSRGKKDIPKTDPMGVEPIPEPKEKRSRSRGRKPKTDPMDVEPKLEPKPEPRSRSRGRKPKTEPKNETKIPRGRTGNPKTVTVATVTQPKRSTSQPSKSKSADVQISGITLNKSKDMSFWESQSANEMRAQIALRVGRSPAMTGQARAGTLDVIRKLIREGKW